jgi:hypothetical protein
LNHRQKKRPRLCCSNVGMASGNYHRISSSTFFRHALDCARLAPPLCLAQPCRICRAHSKNAAILCKSAVFASRISRWSHSITSSLPVRAGLTGLTLRHEQWTEPVCRDTAA